MGFNLDDYEPVAARLDRWLTTNWQATTPQQTTTPECLPVWCPNLAQTFASFEQNCG
jgi:hypothetical protein